MTRRSYTTGGRARSVTSYIYVQPEGPTLDGEELDEVEVEVTGRVTPFVRGRYSGPPERCYPDEGGDVEDVEATVAGAPWVLTDAEEEKASDAIREKADEDAEEDDGPDPDDERDARRCGDYD